MLQTRAMSGACSSGPVRTASNPVVPSTSLSVSSMGGSPVHLRTSRSQPAFYPRPSGGPRRGVVTMAGKSEGLQPFAPLVVVARNIIGEKDFNKIRGNAISLHSQVIKEFCKQFGVDTRQVQGLIRLAKKNGEWLGFLA